MQIYLAADHRGFHLKNKLKSYLDSAGYDLVVCGSDSLEPGDDFPLLAQTVAHKVLSCEDPEARGILICGSGQGMCIAANRFKGIRAALGYSRQTIKSSRNDNDVNVLCLSADEAENTREVNVLVETFLNTPFANASRYIRRIKTIDEIGF
jgi:ribose 5-phosphate isomerase B